MHLAIVIIEQRIVGDQFLTRANVAHGHQYDVPGETYVGLAGVIEEKHHWFVLGVLQGDQVKALRDRDVRVLEPLRQGAQGSGVHDMAALNRHDLVLTDRRYREQPRPWIVLACPLTALGEMKLDASMGSPLFG